MATETTRAGRARHAITIPNPDRPLKRNEKGEITDAGERKTYQYGDIVSLTADQAKDPVILAALMSESENAGYEAKLAAQGLPVGDEDERGDNPGLTGERVDDAGTPGGATGGTNPDGSYGKTGSAGSSQGSTSTAQTGTASTGGAAVDQGKTGQSADNAKTKADGSPF